MTNVISILAHTAPDFSSAALERLGEHVAGALGPAIVSRSIAFGELTLVVQASDIVYALTYLRDDPALRLPLLHRHLRRRLPGPGAALRRGLPPALAAS